MKSIVDNEKLTALADAIREKTGSSDSLTIDQMKTAIEGISVGGGEGNTLKKLLDNTKSTMYLFYNYQGTSVDDFFQYNDTSNVTNMSYMFYNCRKLETIPLLNTSKVTNMDNMLRDCRSLTTIPLLDTSSVTNMSYMFNTCTSLTTIPLLDTSSVTAMNSAFSSCKALKSFPLLDTSSVTNINSMFSNCDELETIPLLDMISITDQNNANYIVSNCKKLTNLTLKNIKVTLQIGSGTSWGHLLTLDSLINTCKECINVGSSKTLTIGTANLEKLANLYVKFADPSVTIIPTNEKGDVVVCESTDEGAMLISNYMTLKNWTLA